MPSVGAALQALREGSFVLVYDADGREEETDLVVASQFVGPNAVRTRFSARAGGTMSWASRSCACCLCCCCA